MTVRELIEKLSRLDDDVLVVMASDGEGNSFSYLTDVEASHYTQDTGFAFSPECHHPDDVPNCPGAKPCVCLWPN